MSTRAADPDQILVDRVKAGDQQAFTLLVHKYERRLLRLIGRLVRDPAEQEDIAQEAFLKAYRALPEFRGESAFYTWLYRIAVNTAKNQLSRQSRMPLLMSDLMNLSSGEDPDTQELQSLSAVSADISTPERELHSQQVAEAVNRAMDALPAEIRTALAFRELEGLSYEEIAQAMGCPIGTVRSRIFRGREAIAQVLRPLLDTPESKRW